MSVDGFQKLHHQSFHRSLVNTWQSHPFRPLSANPKVAPVLLGVIFQLISMLKPNDEPTLNLTMYVQ
jgi:hypothetical protein